MRCRLTTGYRKGGRLLPAGSVLDLAAAERELLGAGAVPAEEPEPQPAPKADDPETGTDLAATLEEMDTVDPDRERPDWWTRAGKPEVGELRRRGHVLSAAQRAAAWENYLETRSR